MTTTTPRPCLSPLMTASFAFLLAAGLLPASSALAQGDGLFARFYQSREIVDGRIVFDNLTEAFSQVEPDVQHWNGSSQFRWEPVPGWGNNYSVEWEGFILIETPGEYGFGTISDDGSEVWIDCELVVANAESQWYDWEDNLTEGDEDDPMPTVNLTPGYHRITVRFWEGASFDGIELWWLLPGSGESVIPYNGTNFHDDPPTFNPSTNWERVPGEVLYTNADDTCFGDTNGDGAVDVEDLLNVLGQWGECGGGGCTGCLGDITIDGIVDVSDLLGVLGSWGDCT